MLQSTLSLARVPARRVVSPAQNVAPLTLRALASSGMRAGSAATTTSSAAASGAPVRTLSSSTLSSAQAANPAAASSASSNTHNDNSDSSNSSSSQPPTRPASFGEVISTAVGSGSWGLGLLALTALGAWALSEVLSSAVFGDRDKAGTFDTKRFESTWHLDEVPRYGPEWNRVLSHELQLANPSDHSRIDTLMYLAAVANDDKGMDAALDVMDALAPAPEMLTDDRLADNIVTLLYDASLRTSATNARTVVSRKFSSFLQQLDAKKHPRAVLALHNLNLATGDVKAAEAAYAQQQRMLTTGAGVGHVLATMGVAGVTGLAYGSMRASGSFSPSALKSPAAVAHGVNAAAGAVAVSTAAAVMIGTLLNPWAALIAVPSLVMVTRLATRYTRYWCVPAVVAVAAVAPRLNRMLTDSPAASTATKSDTPAKKPAAATADAHGKKTDTAAKH